MTFQRRLVLAVALVAAATLGGAFAVVAAAINRAQERQLDDALRREAKEEAGEIAALGETKLAISARPGPAANDVGPLTKYAVIYGDNGAVLAMTDTFRGRPPPYGDLRRPPWRCFNLWFEGEHLRGVFAPLPSPKGAVLLLAAPRLDLDADEAFLARAMLRVWLVAIIWAALMAGWVVYYLTRGQQAVTAVVRRVAAGDLTARIGKAPADRETAQLMRDVDDMIERLDKLVQSQRRFIANAAHEMRSPLTTVLGELSLALRRPRDADGYRAAIAEALASTRHLKALTEDLLTLSRLEGAPGPRGGGELLSPAEIVDQAVREVEGAARERGVEIIVQGSGPAVRGTQADLVRMLRNLLENAVRHSPAAGLVTVTLGAEEDGLTITVADEGPGVPAEERERVFDAFYRGPWDRARSLPGAGLGLTMAREIARAHGGDLALRGDAPSGAAFVIRLPQGGAAG